MELSTAKRKRAPQNRSSRATSTSTSESRDSRKRNRRKKTNTPKPEETEEDYYQAKRIIQQRFSGGRLEYYVDWEDNPKTGEIYQPTWEPEENCTEALIESWQKSQTQSHSQDRSQNHSPPHSETVSQDSGASSPPIFRAKRRRITIESPIASQERRPPPKKPRRAGTVESARFQSVSQETVDSDILPEEIKDSYEEEDQEPSEHRFGVPQVEVQVPQGFDRDAYARFLSSSQLSENSQPAQVTQNFEQTSNFNSHTSQTSANRKPFLWDEDLPETQLPGSSSYKLSTVASSKTRPTETQQAGTVSSGFLEAAESRSAQRISSYSGSQATGNIESQLAEPESYFANTSYTEGNHPSSSPGSYFAVEPSSSSRLIVGSTEDVPRPGFQSSFALIAESSVLSVPSQPPAGNTKEDPFCEEEVRLSIEQPAGLRFHSVDSGSTRLRATEGSQAEDLTSSSVPFQSQLPADDREQSSTASFDISDFSQHAQVVEEITQTLEHEPSPESPSIPIERTRSFQATWHAAQVESSAQGPNRLPVKVTGNSQPLFSSNRSRRGELSQVAGNPQNRAQSHPLISTQRGVHGSRASTAPLYPQIPLLTSRSDILHSQESDLQSPLPRESTPRHRPSRISSTDPVTPRNRTPSFCSDINFNMEQTPPDPSTARYDAKTKIAEMMAAARAKTAAKQAARSSSTFSPSPAPTPAINQKIPSLEASPTLPVYTPVRELTIPVSPPRLSPEPSPDDEVSPKCLKIVTQGRDEFIIPLPMTTYTRDVYYQTIRNYKTQASTFLEDEVFSETLVGEIDSMLRKLSKLCDHQDLDNNDPSTQRQDSAELQAKWAETVSTKCIFLVEFLLLLRQYEKHIVVLVRPGRMLEILESLCISHKFVYNRADEPGWSGTEADGPLKVTLLPTGGEIYVVDSASVVVAFDSTARSVLYLDDFRTSPASPTVLAPVLSLVVTHSVEHLERCFHTDVEHTGRKVKMVSYLYHIAGNVGKLDLDEYPDPAGAAKVVAEYVVAGASNTPWPIMAMPDIEGIDSSSNSPHIYEKDGQLSGDSEVSSSEILHSGIKRHSEEMMMSMASPKRQKLTPVPVGQEDITNSYSDENVPRSSTDSVPEIAKSIVPEEPEDNGSSSLLQRISDLEAQLRKREAAETDLRQINQDLEYRCQDYESSIREIQPKYQEALNDRGQFENEAKLALEREAQMRRQRDAKDVELRRVQDRQDLIDSELDAARLALSTSAIPQVAELGSMKAEVERLKAENENLAKRLTNMSKDMDYMRTEYQRASSAASSAAVEAREAQSLIADLREKSNDTRIRVHEIQHENEGTYLRQRIKELEAEKADVVRANEKLDAELKALSNGRRGTRGTSVPRSPRMGGTMSPGPARPIGRMIQGSGSRGNSPAPGDFAPNRMGFGEALFQGTPTARWGNHLQ